VDWIDRWPNWPDGILALSGARASGKTHLMEVWRAMSGAGRIEAAALSGDGWMDFGNGIALDGMGGPVDENALFHAINWVRQRGLTMLIAGETPPAAWPVTLPDLRSRLAAIPVAKIDKPDDALMDALIVKQFTDRQLAVTPEVVAWLRLRLERSFEAVRAAVARIDAAALAEKRAITLPFLRRVLDDESRE
jgi:chromosomal replication initiation ATPase DnaA